MYDEPFSITHPDIAAEWSEKNAPLTPADFTAGAHERVWWKCKLGHEWQTKINNRCINNTGCPYCTSRLIKKGFNDFATLYPELLKEWSDKNGDLKPEDFCKSSTTKVWWKCKNGHEYLMSFHSRTIGYGCTYCSNKVVLKGYNDLATVRPDLAAEWSDRNLPITPDSIIWKKQGSFWWKCNKCGNEFKAWLVERIKYNSICPFCAGYKLMPGYNDFKTTDPEIAKDWDYENNGSLRPDQYYRTSNWFVKWKCSNGHSYGMKISERTTKGKGCVICDVTFKASFPELLILHLAKKKGLRYEIGSDVSELFLPDLKLAFEAECVSQEKKKDQRKRKSELKKEGITLRIMPRAENLKVASQNVRRLFRENSVKISGKIEDDIEELKKDFYGADYREAPYDGGGDFKNVPGIAVLNHPKQEYISLREAYPKLCEEWSEKNFPFKPEDEHAKSNSKVWWKCPKCGSEYKSMISNRARLGHACPICAGKIIVPGINDLTTTHPEICEEWSPKNGDLKPEQYTHGSRRKVWWRCKKNHDWQTSINNRALGNGCPICAKEPVIKGINDLKTTNPEILKYWSDKNVDLKPEDIRASYRKQVWWICGKCGNEYLAQPHSVIEKGGIGCKRCQSMVGRGWKNLVSEDEIFKEEYR